MIGEGGRPTPKMSPIEALRLCVTGNPVLILRLFSLAVGWVVDCQCQEMAIGSQSLILRVPASALAIPAQNQCEADECSHKERITRTLGRGQGPIFQTKQGAVAAGCFEDEAEGA